MTLSSWFTHFFIIFFVLIFLGCGVPSQSTNTEEVATAPEISLSDVVLSGDLVSLKQHIAAGSDLNAQNPESGATALIAAALFGQTEAAIILIDAGADLELKNNEGSTALITAAFVCREEIVKSLIESGADRDARNKSGSTALDSVQGPFEEAKPIYDIIHSVFKPYGLDLDYDFIKQARPKIANILQFE